MNGAAAWLGVVGLWVLCQVFGGHALERTRLLSPNGPPSGIPPLAGVTIKPSTGLAQSTWVEGWATLNESQRATVRKTHPEYFIAGGPLAGL